MTQTKTKRYLFQLCEVPDSNLYIRFSLSYKRADGGKQQYYVVDFAVIIWQLALFDQSLKRSMTHLTSKI